MRYFPGVFNFILHVSQRDTLFFPQGSWEKQTPRLKSINQQGFTFHHGHTTGALSVPLPSVIPVGPRKQAPKIFGNQHLPKIFSKENEVFPASLDVLRLGEGGAYTFARLPLPFVTLGDYIFNWFSKNPTLFSSIFSR